MKNILTVFVFLLLIISSVSAQKMTVQEVINKHLDSIGTAENRNAVKNRVVIGDATLKFISQKDFTSVGRVVMASADRNNFFGINLNSADYPSERFGFNGDKVKVSYIRSGTRSPLGNFILSNESLLEHSIFGGVLFTSWAVNRFPDSPAKISYDGTKKSDDKEYFVLSYSNKSSIDIKLFFDKQTFQHTKTEYRQIVSAGIGSRPEQSSRFSETRVKITEDFFNFKTVSNLTLPHSYRINYLITGQGGSMEMQWSFEIAQILLNQKLEDKTFEIETE